MAVRWPKLRPNSPGRAPGPIRLDAALPGPAALRAATEATGRREAALAALPARIAKRWIMPGRRETRVGQRLRHFWAMALPPAPPGARVLGIVLAHFNIDEGSRIELQLPEPVALVEEDVLPDLMLPEGSHHREDDHTTFFVTPVAPECAGGDGISARPRVVCYNVIRAYRDPSVARGLRLYALGVLTTLPSCHILRAPLILALDSYIKHPAPSVLEQAWSVLSQLNRAELPACPPARRRLLRRTVAGGASSMLAAGRVAQEGGAPLRPAAVQDGALHRPEACVHRVNLTWSQSGGDGAAGSAPAGPVVTLRVPLHREPEEVGVLAASDLVTRYGVGVAALYWAVLLEQRVLVVGHREAAASTVCDGVLTAAALVAPPLVGVVARAHPYSCLGSLDFLDQRGFIAGMTNPIFASQPGKWDLCLDAATGTVRGPDNAPCHADTVAAADVALSFIRHHRRRQRTGHTHGADSGPATGVQGAPGPADAPSAGGATRGSEEDAHSVDPGLLHAMTRWDEELMARLRLEMEAGHAEEALLHVFRDRTQVLLDIACEDLTVQEVPALRPYAAAASVAAQALRCTQGFRRYLAVREQQRRGESDLPDLVGREGEDASPTEQPAAAEGGEEVPPPPPPAPPAPAPAPAPAPDVKAQGSGEEARESQRERLARVRAMRERKAAQATGWRVTSSKRPVRRALRSSIAAFDVREVGIDLHRTVRRIVTGGSIHVTEAETLWRALASSVKTSEEVEVLLSLLPPLPTGILPIAQGLLSSSPRVRKSTASLLRRMKRHDVARPEVECLNAMLLHALELVPDEDENDA